MSNQAIADRPILSLNTIKWYTKGIYSKLREKLGWTQSPALVSLDCSMTSLLHLLPYE